MNAAWLLVLNLAATWYMVGLIWMVQVVHYPLFDRVGEPQFARYESEHARRITPIVGLPMLLELATAAALAFQTLPGFPRWVAISGLVLVLTIWLSTALIQVPCHAKLEQGFDAETHNWLVTSNWIRTLLWSVRGVLMSYFVARMLASDGP